MAYNDVAKAASSIASAHGLVAHGKPPIDGARVGVVTIATLLSIGSTEGELLSRIYSAAELLFAAKKSHRYKAHSIKNSTPGHSTIVSQKTTKNSVLSRKSSRKSENFIGSNAAQSLLVGNGKIRSPRAQWRKYGLLVIAAIRARKGREEEARGIREIAVKFTAEQMGRRREQQAVSKASVGPLVVKDGRHNNPKGLKDSTCRPVRMTPSERWREIGKKLILGMKLQRIGSEARRRWRRAITSVGLSLTIAPHIRFSACVLSLKCKELSL